MKKVIFLLLFFVNLNAQNSILNIGACDVGFKYDSNKYIETLNNFDSFVFVNRIA